MKILLLTSFFPPTHNAGTEKRTFGYAQQLIHNGHQVDVICAGDWAKGDQYWNGILDDRYHEINVRRVNLNWSLAPDANKYLYSNPLITDYMGNWIGEIKPDLVHITSCYSLSASVLETVKEAGIPLVLTLTDFWFICPKHTLLRFDNSLCDGNTSNRECLDCLLDGNMVYRKLRPFLTNDLAAAGIEWVSRTPGISNRQGFRGMALNMGERKSYLHRVINLPDAVVAPSNYLKEVFNLSGVSRDIQVIHSGHDLSWLTSIDQQTRGEKLNFGFVGQITWIKGLHLLIKAFQMSSLSDHANLLVFGSMEQDSDYQEVIRRSINGNSDSIFLRGGFPHEDLGKVLAEIDILIVPSIWHENNPRVVQEAFASGTPVITSAVGGMAEFVEHEVNGLLFKRDDNTDLAWQLKRIIDEPNLLDQLRNGIGPVKTIENEVEELISLYKEFIH